MTLTDIAGYLHHGLIGYHHQGAICKIDMAFADKYGVELCNYRPVLRPMTDISTEITEKGYNDGKPFVPIVELANAWSGEPIPDYRILQHVDFVGIETYNHNMILAWWLKDRYFDAWRYGFGLQKGIPYSVMQYAQGIRPPSPMAF